MIQLTLWASMVLLVVAGLLSLRRLRRGPTTFDRAVALDVAAAGAVGLVAVTMAITRTAELMPLLVVLASVSFISSTTIARFAPTEREEPSPMMSPIKPLASAIEPSTPLIEPVAPVSDGATRNPADDEEAR